MEKKIKGIQVYGIIVCIISIITFIICVSLLVTAIIDRSEPIYSNYYGKDLSSFESYKMDVLKTVTEDQVYTPDDETIMNMYEAAKTEKHNKALHETKSSIIVNSLLIVFSIILFLIHWRIINRYSALRQAQ
jgi:NADH:ubiquinone oxidoreductase subunit 3 (subunit A)